MIESYERHECKAHSMELVSSGLLFYDRVSNRSEQRECRRPVPCMVTDTLKYFNAGEGGRDVMDGFPD